MTIGSGENNFDVDVLRRELSSARDDSYKAELGQFLTPQPIAKFMASLFSKNTVSPIRLLDPGCGHGALSYAFVNQFQESQIEIEGWEIDLSLHSQFKAVLKASANKHVKLQLHGNDFIKEGAIRHITRTAPQFTHAILNPPYKKISASSETRQFLMEVKIQSVNLYTAFLALTILLTQKSGEIVSITPRSFFNGSYYRPFRSLLLNFCSIDRIHLFDSRKRAFSDDSVLQENVILKLTKGKKQGRVVVSRSLDQDLNDYSEKEYAFEEIVFPNDEQLYFHVPNSQNESTSRQTLPKFSLKDLDLDVCTGPVVDFRLKDHCSQVQSETNVPLIYPFHFRGGVFNHPKENKKPNWIEVNDASKKWLMESGCFVLTKRFTSKEEKKRVVAHVLQQEDIQHQFVGIENHLNVFHRRKKGIPENLALGLATYLNSPEVDEYFRTFSGHTQVNATDLRRLPYPSLQELILLGEQQVKKAESESALNYKVASG
jgi:adenine-specific DNA-methyltransferase